MSQTVSGAYREAGRKVGLEALGGSKDRCGRVKLLFQILLGV
jgi:hypothetical protein